MTTGGMAWRCVVGKGRPWDADLKVVTVPEGAEPKPVTIIYPYYENPTFLKRQLAWWATYPALELNAIIVDDGSPTSPAADVVESGSVPFPIRVFRIDVDVRWNWLAARNIGFEHAADGWCIVTDMDHVIPASTASRLVYGHHDAKVIYGFTRIEHTGEKKAAHPNSWFLTRDMFWTVGGYDETLSGHYGTDGDWRRRMAKVAPIQILSDRLIRYEYQDDASTTRYQRKQPQDAAVSRLVATRGPGWRPKTLSFPYHEVRLRQPAGVA